MVQFILQEFLFPHFFFAWIFFYFPTSPPPPRPHHFSNGLSLMYKQIIKIATTCRYFCNMLPSIVWDARKIFAGLDVAWWVVWIFQM